MTTAAPRLTDEDLAHIAAVLGHWRVIPEDGKPCFWRRELRASAGESLGLHLMEQDGRLRISGIFPRCADGTYVSQHEEGGRQPEISVAFTRPPDAIAAEIRRRLLPRYWG